MLYRAISTSAISSLGLIILLIAQVSAAPSMGVGSKASYNLTIKFSSMQSCNASPLVYNQTACGLPVPAYHVFIIDENATVCLTIPNSCFFSPANVSVLPGNTVVWSNLGRVAHAVASCDQSNSAVITTGACPVMDNPSLASFDSGPGGLTNGQSFSYTFTTLGVYYYFDPIHPWMHGQVNVSLSASAPPPGAVSIQTVPPPITISGNLGWSVVGLDSNTAVLNVTHALSVFVDGISIVPVAPISESGSIQDSINLSTRAESHGTAAEVVDNFLLPFLSLGLTGSFSGTSPLTVADSLSSRLPTIYTIWWVNGPLSNGSPVHLLIGYSSVQGDETVNLPGVGTRSAWIVTSNVAEDVSAFVPKSSSPSPGAVSMNRADARLALKFDYDKSSDLLLSSSDSAIITATSTSVYLPGQVLCGSSGQCISVSSLTTVSREMTATVTASLALSSTNLNLAERAGGGSGHGSGNLLTMLQDAMSQPVLVTLAGVVAAATAAVVVWITKRLNRGNTSAAGSIPHPAPAPQ